METGKLRDRVTVQRLHEIEEVGGAGTLTTWTDIQTIWANVEAVKGLVALDTKQIGEYITHKITTRYFDFINSEKWVQFGNRRFRIRNVQNVEEQNRYLILMCREDSTISNTFQAGINHAGDDLAGQ